MYTYVYRIYEYMDIKRRYVWSDTYASAYEYPLRLPASNEGDSPTAEVWTTGESG